MIVRGPVGYGGGASKGKQISIGFKVSDSVLAQVQCIADEREWTLNHVAHKLLHLGLEVYLRQSTLPHPFELSGLPLSAPSEEVAE